MSAPDAEVVLVNGEPHEAVGQTVTELVAALGGAPGGRGVAVAVGGEVVPRSAWGRRHLVAGDRVEVLGAIQGG